MKKGLLIIGVGLVCLIAGYMIAVRLGEDKVQVEQMTRRVVVKQVFDGREQKDVSEKTGSIRVSGRLY